MQKYAPDYLISLREATKALHINLENLTEGKRLLKGDFDINHYSRLIACHYFFHKEVAAHIAKNDKNKPSILDWPNCIRINALRKDLNTIDIAISENEVPHIEHSSYAFSLGLCYVSEGSCMGNQQLLRALNKHEDFKNKEIDNFFKSCKTDFSIRWKSFLKLLQPVGENAYQDLENGAIAGFKHFTDLWMFLAPYFENSKTFNSKSNNQLV